MTDIPDIEHHLGRLPEAGRIRMGKKGKDAPIKLSTWRLTSTNQAQIESAANVYGGTAVPWHNDAIKRDEWEVITETASLNVLLSSVGVKQSFVLRKGSAIIRRCDGVTAEIAASGPEGEELISQECICSAQDELECKPSTMLSVILADIPFKGAWRLVSTGWNAFYELPSQDFIIKGMTGSGLVPAVLGMEERVTKGILAGKPITRRFVVPTLSTNITPNQAIANIASGLADARALPGPDSDNYLDVNYTSILTTNPPEEITEIEAGPTEPQPISDTKRALLDKVRHAWVGADEPTKDALMTWTGGELPSERWTKTKLGEALNLLQGTP